LAQDPDQHNNFTVVALDKNDDVQTEKICGFVDMRWFHGSTTNTAGSGTEMDFMRNRNQTSD
jgi:hypothetical protein